MILANGKTVEGLGENGWILLMRRQDGSIDFPNKLWNDYKNGFGQLGNEIIHSLTTTSSYRVRFDLVTFDGRWAYAEYSTFSIGPESDNYRLHIGGYSGNASDEMFGRGIADYIENNMPFTTLDRDNDNLNKDLCCCGGWWFNRCGYVRLTGRYGLPLKYLHGVSWGSFDQHLAYADMKIKQH
ncbi:hypothetical protein LSH36_528g02006 [Paralvinella palmiformis]|uniref:Fibrinogen C-terminal domain-containing protein n=1 Tax=Paralvinella palmiformis TaxID=53620 RepID=A0AAD9J7T4_9ANNE|nr:hypothetical protein LSH36_528g02006 [Paralvinella palmiformis]